MSASAPPRFHPEPAARMREAIAEAGGIEVFAVGDVDADGRICALEVLARGNQHQVVALFRRLRPGQAAIHNHPSGVLEASQADLAMAQAYGEQGVGVVIVDNALLRELWVVEPVLHREVPVDPARIERVFGVQLPAALPGWEQRPGQLELARAVAERLNEGGVLVAEAGTGTGKSLAYLAPALLWASANDGRVLISTYTRALQDQLAGSDLPQLRAAGLQFEWAVVKGRSNYLCRRRLEEALAELGPGGAPEEDEEGAERRELAQLSSWAVRATEGTREECSFPIGERTWEAVASDRHQCLGVRCPAAETCFYLQARRRAAAAHLVVANHSLLLADQAIKLESGGIGVLPPYDRVVLDEAHHLEDAATTAGTARVTALAMTRAVAPLLPRGRRRPGALARLRSRWGGLLSPLEPGARARVTEACDLCERLAVALRGEAQPALEATAWAAGLAEQPLPLDGPDPAEAGPAGSGWREPLALLIERVAEAARALGALEKQLKDLDMEPAERQPVLDLRQARLRLAAQAEAGRAALDPSPDHCRWIEAEGRARQPALCRAPIDVAPFLGSTLWVGCRSAVLCSATLAVRNSFDFVLGRLGLQPQPAAQPVVIQRSWPSPFDFAAQVLLGLPRDLPAPDQPEHEQAALRVLIQALRSSGGGAFVLCTSFQQLRALAAGVEAALGTRMAILRQGEGARWNLLERFREDRDSVLFGTDSFWEGVSVKGDALRLVVIPRLPFGVPTEPIALARHARLRASGSDPFRADSLPRAVLKLRQGFGRLVRAHDDRGVVLILDRRLHDRWYGRHFLAALPPATRALGPSQLVLERLARFYGSGSGGAGPC